MAQKRKPAAKKAAKPKVKPEALQDEVVQETAPQAAQKQIDLDTYTKYVDLKFLALGEHILSDEKKEELARLEKQVKACSGQKAARTVRAGIGCEQYRLVEGMPMPAEYVKAIKSQGERAVSIYFA